MSLDTVLKIGKALRMSNDSLKYFKYVGSVKKDVDKKREREYPICITIPVKGDLRFDWGDISLTPENQRDDLYYFKYETSNNDSSPKKYLFGDISYTRRNGFDKKGKLKKTIDFGNYTLERGNAFKNGESILNEIKLTYFEEEIKELINDSTIENLKEKNEIIKQLIKSYKIEKEIKLSDKLEKYKDEINKISRKISRKINGITLFDFHDKFEEFSDEITLILKYAPAFNSLLSESKKMDEYLTNKQKLVDLYTEVIIEQINPRILKNILKEDEDIKSLSEETKNKISKYANFEVFLHFDYQGRSWYKFNHSFNLLNEKLNLGVTDNTEFGKVPSKAIYRTLCSGNDKNDIQFPKFDINNRIKSFFFKEDEFIDLLHSEDFTEKPLRRLQGTSIEFYVLPVAINENKQIEATDYDDFLKLQDEIRIKMYDKDIDEEPLFSFFGEEQINFTKFDFIFTDASGNSKNDLIEISGLEQSKLKVIAKRIEKINQEIKQEKKRYLRTQNKQYNFKIEYSFRNILGSYYYDEKTKKTTVKANPKYQSHLLKTLPLIYTDNYYNDEMLLPAFIQNVETSIRFGDPKYTFLKFDLMFLYKIQNNNNSKNDKYMEITNSKSYQIGLKIGKIAKPLKNAINSFEKSYVGLISRRTNSIDECIAFLNEIDQKLIMHAKHFGKSISAEVRNELANLSISKYDKEKIVFGFFEGYFKYEATDKKKDFFNRLEKLAADNKDNEELQNEVEQLNILIEEIKIDEN